MCVTSLFTRATHRCRNERPAPLLARRTAFLLSRFIEYRTYHLCARRVEGTHALDEGRQCSN